MSNEKNSKIGVEGSRIQKVVMPTKKISSAQMNEKRRKWLCYHYEKKWNPAHVSKNPKAYLLQVEDQIEEEAAVRENSREVSTLV